MRNNPKPGGKIDWDATGNIVEPSIGRKISGWLFGVKPPAQNFNWFWNLVGLQQFYSNAQVEDWIVIDSDADEGDYATLAEYIADAPVAGDRILVKEDQTITAQLAIPSFITLKLLDGVRLLSSTNIATSVLKLNDAIVIEGVLNILLSHTGTTAKAVEFDDDKVVGIINVVNSSTGTLTTAYHINANKTGNKVHGIAQNPGGGTITNILVDNSTEDSNLIEIVDEPNNQIVRSRGAYKFREGLEFDLGSDVDGDIYYRDAGVLKRLPKGTDDDVLRLKSGLPNWEEEPLTKIIDIGDWNMNSITSIAVAHGLIYDNIRAVTALIRADADTTHYDINYANESGTGDNGARANTLNVVLVRRTGGFFDQVDFDATSYNRGWIIITYIA